MNATSATSEPGRPLSPAERLLRVTWQHQLRRSEQGVPLLAPELVLELGRAVALVDVREEAELTGPLGHIPGATWVAAGRIDEVAAALPTDTPVVLVSGQGERAGAAARALEGLGMTMVAAMRGGMVEWRALGFATVRETIGVQREIAAPVVCAPASAAGPLDQATIAAHVGDPSTLRKVRMAAFLMQSKTSCVDGRDDHGVVGSPGGDAGEFVLALAAVEALTGRTIDDAAVERLLGGAFDTFGRFYMHTDLGAINRFIAAMRADPALEGALPPRDAAPALWRRWNAAPPAEFRGRIVEHLIRPEHTGCGHLRLILENGEAYGVRRGLADAFLRAFFRLRWAGAVEAEYVILGGGHQEGAVVNVTVEGEIWPFTRIPLVSPMCGGVQIFVNHPQVVAYLRRQSAGWFCQQPGLGLEVGDHEALFERMQELAGRQLELTLGRLAKGLPIYEVRFGGAGEVAVRG